MLEAIMVTIHTYVYVISGCFSHQRLSARDIVLMAPHRPSDIAVNQKSLFHENKKQRQLCIRNGHNSQTRRNFTIPTFYKLNIIP